MISQPNVPSREAGQQWSLMWLLVDEDSLELEAGGYFNLQHDCGGQNLKQTESAESLRVERLVQCGASGQAQT